MSSSQKSFIFAFIMCIVCGLLLTTASQSLKQRQKDNVELDRQKNVLKALSLLKTEEKPTREMIQSLYKSKVNEKWTNSEGDLLDSGSDNLLPIYVLEGSSGVDRYAVPFEAYGLWSWVKGYIGLKGDGNTIIGFTVYSHAETPGLGGEVDKAWFQNQFKNKKIRNKAGEFVSIGVVKGKVVDVIPEGRRQNYVDGMSGATITGDGLQKYIKIQLLKYESFANRLKG
jgi:Na+-transporting NADH:ubiquinone oxidoreductase subunit C